jgi:hypothetical protein
MQARHFVADRLNDRDRMILTQMTAQKRRYREFVHFDASVRTR